MLIKNYGTTRWTDKKTGKEMSRYRTKYTHFNETCLKLFIKLKTSTLKYYNIGQTKDPIAPLLHWRTKNVIIYRMKKKIF